MLDDISSNGLLFADDMKIFQQISSKPDALVLQEDIQKLETWTKHWLLRFNINKCHVLTLGKFEHIRYTHRYRISDTELEHVFDEKDLGIIVDSDLSFDEHICSKVNKANQIMGLIRRSFAHLDPKSFVKLYTALVRPHLEYGQSVWSPHLKKHQNLIENVQMRATKQVDGLNNLQYSERLKLLNLPTLVYRRLRGDAIEIFKHFKLYDTEIISNTFQRKQRINRRHQFQLYERRAKDGIRGVQNNSFYYRTAKMWNELPEEVVNATTIDTFKNKLDKYWNEMPIKFSYDEGTTSDS